MVNYLIPTHYTSTPRQLRPTCHVMTPPGGIHVITGHSNLSRRIISGVIPSDDMVCVL
jgi:hypothetical protein